MKLGFRIPFLRDPHECEHVRSQMTDYLDDELAEDERRRIERHVRFCPRCRRVLGNLRATIDRLAALGASAPESPEVEDDALARITTGWRHRRD